MTDILYKLTKALDGEQPQHNGLDAYYAGRQSLAYLSPEAKEALGQRFGRMVANIPRLAVTSLAERLRITGFDGVDIWPAWTGSDMPQLAGMAHREALALGVSYIGVWGRADRTPIISVESARQCTHLTDPETGQVTAAIKRWSTDATTTAIVYEPHQIVRYEAPITGATSGGFKAVQTLDNPLNTVPLVPLINAERIGGEHSEITDLIPLVDGLNKVLADALVASEYFARPRRYAAGIELTEDDEGKAVNPFPESHRMMISENHEAKFGQLEAGDLGSYESSVRVLLGQIMAVSALPAHYVGVLTQQPTSADALRASEASLTARAESRQQTFGRPWERVAQLVHAVQTGEAVDSTDPRIAWADPATRSQAQEADAVVKLHQSGLLPASYALKRLGYTDDQVEEIRTARRLEAIDTAPLGPLAVNGDV